MLLAPVVCFAELVYMLWGKDFRGRESFYLGFCGGSPLEPAWLEPPQKLESLYYRGHAFSSGGRACDLCLTEKRVILIADQNSMLNKRDELLETKENTFLYIYLKKEPPDTTTL